MVNKDLGHIPSSLTLAWWEHCWAGKHVPDPTLVTDSRSWAARACGQPAANATESAPEITPILKEFPLCKKSTCAKVINGFHTSRPWMWKTCFRRNGKEKDFFPPSVSFFNLNRFFPKALKVTAQTAWFPCVQRGADFGMQKAVSGRTFSSCYPNLPNPTTGIAVQIG